MPDGRLWFFDTVVLSNFALADRLDVLVDRYGTKGHVTQEVLTEIHAGIVAGYPALRVAADKVTTGGMSLAAPLTPQERVVYLEALRCLASGEASCIACAQYRGGIVVTDDRAARNGCADRELPCTGTIGILKASCVDGTLRLVEADDILGRMVETGFYSPVRRISDLL